MNDTSMLRHVGCVAASFCLVKELRRRFGDDVEIVRIPATAHRLGPGAPHANETLDDFVEHVGRTSHYMDALSCADLVVLNAEGTLHWPCNNDRVWAWLALAALAKERFQSALWIVNAAFFSEDRRFTEFGVGVFSKADHVAMRDPLSLEAVTQAGVRNAVQAADLVFLTPPRISPEVESQIAQTFPFWRRDEAGPRILLAGSSAMTPETREQWSEGYLSVMRQLRAGRPGSRFLFVAQPGMGLDPELAQQVSSLEEHVRVLDTPIVSSDLIWLLRQSDVVISGRFHINCLAVLAGTPAIMFPGNTPKNRALAELLASPRYRLADPGDPEAAVRICRELAQGGSSAARPDEPLAGRLRELALRNFPDTGASGRPEGEVVGFPEYVAQTKYLGECLARSPDARVDDHLARELGKERDEARVQRDEARVQRDKARVQRDKARVQRDKARRALKRIESSTAYKLGGALRSLAYVFLPGRKKRMRDRERADRAAAGTRQEQTRPAVRFRDAEVKVLHYALTPVAGAPIRVCRLLSKSADISAVCVNQRTAYKDGRVFPHDICYAPGFDVATQRTVAGLLEEADVVHFHNESYYKHPDLFDGYIRSKHCCVQWHSGPDEIGQRLGISVEDACAWNEIPVLVVAQKQARFYSHAIPVPNVVDLDDPLCRPIERDRDRIHISYSPTDAVRPCSILCGDKGLEAILAALEEMRSRRGRDVVIHIVRNTPLRECLSIKQRCHICIDDVKSGGYHLSGLEGLAMGCVTIANLDEAMKAFLSEYVGCAKDELPWYPASTEDLVERLEALIRDRETIDRLGRASRVWMEKYWNREFVIRKYRDAYATIMSKA